MQKDSKTISASEINRFTYCPYQWYYEKVYGRQKLGQLAKNRKVKSVKKSTAATKKSNSSAAGKNPAAGNFKRGLAYHKAEYERFQKKQQFQKRMAMLFVAILLVVILFCVLRMG